MGRAAARWAPHVAVIGAALLPAAWLGAQAWRGTLGANPIETLTHVSGDWALRLLLLTLAVTPLRKITGRSWLAPLRRTLGLLAFGYATLHLLTWVALDQFFDWRAMREDVLERRFVTAGMLAYACLLPLALTSTRAALRRLGRRWKLLHRLVYAAAIAAILHYVWLVKADLLAPLAHAALLAGLIGWRLRARATRASPTAPAAGGALS